MLCDSEPKSFEQLSLDSFLPKNEVHLFVSTAVCYQTQTLRFVEPHVQLPLRIVPFLLHLIIFAFVSVQKFDPLWSELS